MARRRLLLALLTYLTLDLSNPFVAGAFNFNPDECVDMIQRVSSSAPCTDASAFPPRGPMVRLERPSPSPARPLAGGRHTVLVWLVHAREDAPASRDASATTAADDH